VIAYFRERSTFQVPVLVLLTLALKAGFGSAAVSSPGYEAIGGLLTRFILANWVPVLRPGFLQVLCTLLLFGSALYANYITGNRRMFTQRNMLVALSMLLFTSLFPASNMHLPALIMLPVFITIFAQITLLYQTQNPRSKIINVGLLAGLAYVLYHPFIFVLPACFIGLSYMRPFKPSEWLLLLVGMLAPLYFVMAFQFLTNHWQPQQHLPAFFGSAVHWKAGPYWWTAIAFTVFWLAIAVGKWQGQTRRMVIQGRKNWYTLLIMGLFCLPGLFLPAGHHHGMLVLLSFPLGTLLANAFGGEAKGIGPLLLFWVLAIVIAVVSWGWKNGAML
jgi:hypothetical protein